MPNPNLQTDLKQDWINNEIVMPADVNDWSERINNLNELMPVYSATGTFYEATYSNSTYTLQPCIFEDNSQNVAPDSYIDGMEVCFKIPQSNLINSKININSLGAKNIKLIDNTNIPENYLIAGDYITFRYNADQDCFYITNNNPINLDKINQSKALETGSVSTDVDVYSDILQYAHSTFDLSKFEVVGSPTISEDGIASGIFNNSTYFRTIVNKSILLNKSWSVTSGKYISSSGNIQIIDLSEPGFGASGVVEFNSGNKNLKFNASFDSTDGGTVITKVLDASDFSYLIARLDFNYSTETYSLYYDIGNGWELAGTYTPTGENKQLYFIVNSPSSSINIYFAYGNTTLEYDLKYYKIWVDGQPVFSANKTAIDTINGTLEIPYTESITGAKIVDAQYRSRVQDVYEQTGTAMYYTIDEKNQNFTLPMGEIYGMIQQDKDLLQKHDVKIQDSIAQQLDDDPISTDTFNYWYNQKYTTFNKGYISTIGTPTMSEFGVISNCGEFDYFLTPSIDVTTADSWEMRFTYTPSGTTPTTAIGLFGSNWLNVSFTTAEKITATVNYTGGSLTLTSTGTFNNDDKIFCKIRYDSTGYKLYASVNHFDYGTAATNTQTAKAASAGALKLGNVSATSYLSQGSIDMKYFEFDINGQNVQNYKQTAIDTIKAPDYTVVGSPTISADGIASGFSVSDYLAKDIYYFSSVDFEFYFAFSVTKSIPDDKQTFVSVADNGLSLFYIAHQLDGSVVAGNPAITIFNTMEPGKFYFVKFAQKDGIKKVYVLDNGAWVQKGGNFTSYPENVINKIWLGRNQQQDNQEPVTQGSIDLNYVSLYIKGQLAYQPCLYIPYTETTDGTKIVDAAYFNRVQSCREQTGQALYLTLDEQNQQYYLPQGTVSGMISQNKQKIDELDTTLTADILQAMPVGASIAYEGTTAPDGWFAENGLEVQKSEYPKLYAVVGDKYNLETTQEGYFRLPDTNVSSRFYEGSTTPGTLKDAGLPNIKATGTGMGVSVLGQVGGAAFNSGVNVERLQGGNHDGKRIDFNASRSNGIYGKSTTVQPKSITKFFIIKHD